MSDMFYHNIMAKYQISITVDEDVLLGAKEHLRDGTFRNKSHLFEYAVRKLLEEK
jgi:Arc/MetJ-type ribon-helix-helix transcriptional regulator